MSILLHPDGTKSYPYSYGGAFGAPTVRVEDLWEVYPELEGCCETPAEFVAKITKAANLIRNENAYEALRARLAPINDEEDVSE